MDWDTNYFGFKTAKILPQLLEENALIKVLNQMREDSIKLAYWPAKEPVEFNTKGLGGLLVDKKVTFIAGLKNIINNQSPPLSQVEKYQADMPEKDLLDLAIQAGQFSRFALDPKFPHEKFIALVSRMDAKMYPGGKGRRNSGHSGRKSADRHGYSSKTERHWRHRFDSGKKSLSRKALRQNARSRGSTLVP